MPAIRSEALDSSLGPSVDRETARQSPTSKHTRQTDYPSARQRTPEFSELVLGCRHHLPLVAVLGGLVGCVLGACAWWLTDAPYEAESLVQVRQHQDVVFAAQTSRSEDIAFVRAQEELVLSPQVLAAALSSKQLLPFTRHIPSRDAVEWLKNLLGADVQIGSEVLSIAAYHPEPEVAQVLCNAVTSSYMREITNRLNTDRQLRQRELERAARAADLKLDALWEELNAVASRLGTESTQSLTIRDEIQLQAYRDYAQQLRVAQMRGNELKQRLSSEQLQQTDETISVDEATEIRLQQQPEIVAARQRVSDINAQIQRMREIVAQDDSPRLKRLYADREFFEADLQRLMNERRPLIRIQSVDQDRITKQNSLAELRKLIEVNEAEKEFLRSRLAEIDTGNKGQDKQSGVQLEISRHAVERQTRLADGLWQSLEELKIEGQSQPRVTLIKLADFPDHANHGKQLKASAACAGLGWLFVIVGIGCREWYSCRVRRIEDLSSHSSLPAFGGPDPTGSLPKDPAGTNCGTREAAARMMLLSAEGARIPSLMVASASADEPRHFVSIELAQAFAAFRQRTLLVDCDFTQTRLSTFLSAESNSGLLNLSADHSDPRKHIFATQEDLLDVLVLGTDLSSTAWIEPKLLRQVLDTVRGEYEAIVVNGPPLLSTAESLLLASQVDQTLLAVFAGKSRWDRVVASERNALDSGIQLAGAVLHSARKPVALQLLQRQTRFGTVQVQPKSSSEPELAPTESDLHEGISSMQQEIQEATQGQNRGNSKPTTVKEVS